MPRTASTLRVQPKRSLLWNGFVGVILGTAPLFWVAYWFTSSRDGFGLIAVLNVITVATALVLVWRQLQVYCAVTPTELIGNGIFTRLVRIPLADIGAVHLVPTHLGAAPEPVLQLLVADKNGRPVFRMRGNYWHVSDLEELAHALPVRITRAKEPMTVRDFFRAYPGSAFWFERNPVAKAIVITAAALTATALNIAAMQVLDLPIAFL